MSLVQVLDLLEEIILSIPQYDYIEEQAILEEFGY